MKKTIRVNGKYEVIGIREKNCFYCDHDQLHPKEKTRSSGLQVRVCNLFKDSEDDEPIQLKQEGPLALRCPDCLKAIIINKEDEQ
jgi:hypothetical protein